MASEFADAEKSFPITLYNETSTEVLKARIFTTVIGIVTTDIIYKAYADRYFVLGNQPGGETGAAKIVVEKCPPKDCPVQAGRFNMIIVKDCEGFEHAAKVIAAGLAVDKPLYLYLSLANYGSETINDFLQILKCHL